MQILPQAGMGRAFGPRHSERRTHRASALEKSPKHAEKSSGDRPPDERLQSKAIPPELQS